jgi:hypothetical protein
MDEIRQELAALRALVEEQRNEIAQIKAGSVRREHGDDSSPTRRQLLMGAAAAVVGGAAAATVAPAEAANGQAMVLGSTGNSASAPTGTAFIGSPGTRGYCLGATDNGLGEFPSSAAIAGHTRGNFRNAVLGYDASNNKGVFGWSVNGWGVHGYSETGQYGVYAYAPNASGLRADGRTAVVAVGTHRGVEASVQSSDPKAIAVLATGTGSGATALAVSGVHRATRAGRVVVPAGQKGVRVYIAPLTTTSLVLATPQRAFGTLAVAGVAVQTAAPTSFVIALTGPAPAGGLPVAWFVVDTMGSTLVP